MVDKVVSSKIEVLGLASCHCWMFWGSWFSLLPCRYVFTGWGGASSLARDPPPSPLAPCVKKEIWKPIHRVSRCFLTHTYVYVYIYIYLHSSTFHHSYLFLSLCRYRCVYAEAMHILSKPWPLWAHASVSKRHVKRFITLMVGFRSW